MQSRSHYTLPLLCLGLLFVGIVFVGCDSQEPITSDSGATVHTEDDGPSPKTQTRAKRSFTLEQGDKCFKVTPLRPGPKRTVKNTRVERFYDYNRSSSHTGLEGNDVSNVFLFDGQLGISLVVIHDNRGDKDGGAASLEFTGLPTGSGQWVVQDDRGDFSSATDSSPDWRWFPNLNDGGAWRGGLDGAFAITVDPTFRRGITDWHFLSGDVKEPDRVALDLKDPVTIRTGTCAIEVDLDIKPGSDPNAINPNSHGLVPVAILHTDDFNPVDRVDVPSLRFGDPEDVETNGAEPAHNGHEEDVDDDGDADLVLHFPTDETAFEGDENEGKLVGETNGGTALFGTDSVKLVGGGNGGPSSSGAPSGNGGVPGNGNGR